MTKLLESAIQQLNNLPESQQDEIAHAILDELSWDKTLHNSSNTLLSLANEALEEYKKGKTKPMDFE